MKTIEQVESLIANTGHCQIKNCDCKMVCDERMKILAAWKAEIENEKYKIMCQRNAPGLPIPESLEDKPIVNKPMRAFDYRTYDGRDNGFEWVDDEK